MVAEVIRMTRQIRTVEEIHCSSDAKLERKIPKRIGGLEGLLLSVVDETLKQVFKEVGAKVVYDYLDYKCHLKREEIAEKPEVFFAGLEGLLGSGMPVIEKLILKNLYRKLALKFADKNGYEFSDYIEELRKS